MLLKFTVSYYDRPGSSDGVAAGTWMNLAAIAVGILDKLPLLVV